MNKNKHTIYSDRPCVYVMCAIYIKCEIDVTVQMCKVQSSEITKSKKKRVQKNVQSSEMEDVSRTEKKSILM